MPKLPREPDRMLICEIYQSIQGEGLDMGRPSVFVRVTGCPLRCKWCDEPRALSDGTVMTMPEILEKVSAYPHKAVCLTGASHLHTSKWAISSVRSSLQSTVSSSRRAAPSP